jgi:2,3-bisphosphoglycerate-dependent phosphoglycerate mutase
VERVVLARHGESERSLPGLTNGDPRVAVALTAAGREEARHLGDELRDDPIDLCVTSEFPRTQETASIALAGRDVPRLVLADLNDIRFGDYEGEPLVDYRKWAHAHGPDDVVPGGDESRAETVARYVRAFRTILERPEHDALVVAHGLPIRYVLEALEGRNPAVKIEFVPYAEPFRLTAGELAEAVDRLDAWVARPAWTT